MVDSKKSISALVSPDRHKTLPKRRRFFPSFWEWLMTRRARRWSWTILEVNFLYFILKKPLRRRLQRGFGKN
jgi:hypothetical protein